MLGTVAMMYGQSAYGIRTYGSAGGNFLDKLAGYLKKALFVSYISLKKKSESFISRKFKKDSTI